jgi:hypothetical protein
LAAFKRILPEKDHDLIKLPGISISVCLMSAWKENVPRRNSIQNPNLSMSRDSEMRAQSSLKSHSNRQRYFENASLTWQTPWSQQGSVTELLVNKTDELIQKTKALKWAVAGGNGEIVRVLEDYRFPMNEAIVTVNMCTIPFHLRNFCSLSNFFMPTDERIRLASDSVPRTSTPIYTPPIFILPSIHAS